MVLAVSSVRANPFIGIAVVTVAGGGSFGTPSGGGDGGGVNGNTSGVSGDRGGDRGGENGSTSGGGGSSVSISGFGGDKR